MTIAEPVTPRRTSGSEKRQRTARTFTRYTPAELAEVNEAASRFGVTVGTFTRSATLSAARVEGLSALPVRSVRRPPVEKELLAKVLGQLGKVGSNLNQLARAGNMGQDACGDVGETLRAVREAAHAVMQALGRRP